MTESCEVVVVRGPSARLGRGLDNAARGQCGHAGRAGSDPCGRAWESVTWARSRSRARGAVAGSVAWSG
jgi:hypothetical protein